jgi:sulfide:quinone oxidoreductase
MSQVVVVGASFAGLTAALELRRHLPATEDIIVISADEKFYFLASLIWVVQGWREIEDISFPIRPVLQEAGVNFIHARLEKIDPTAKKVTISDGRSIDYDKLLISTGGNWAWDSVPGLAPKPEGSTISILSPQEAVEARPYWEDLLTKPGPVVIGATPGSGLYGAAYEFALNVEVALTKAGIRDKVDITFVTPEPYLGHFGHDGLGNSRQIIEEAFASRGIIWQTEAQVTHVEEEAVILAGHRRIASKFTMLVPPYRGIKPVRETPDLADEQGRIPIDNYYSSLGHLDIFAAGVAAQIRPTAKTLLPCGLLITGTMSAQMGHVAAINIAADLGYGQAMPKTLDDLKAFYVLDSASHGLFMSLGSQSWLNLQVNLPGPWSHWAKVVTEKYQMWQIQTGKY